MANSSAVGLGRALFRFRSFTPLPVLLGLAYLLYRSRGQAGPGGPEVDRWLDLLGPLVALLGQGLRFYTLGQVPEGTSGQGSALEARSLNTRGPYARVRNPLYLGNLGICLGLMLLAHDSWVYLLGLGFFFGEYYFIIRAEESYLRERFGPVFEAYVAQVPRWVPRWRPWEPAPLREGFDWARALKKEHNPFAAWASGVLLLFGWERYARGEADGWLALLLSLEGLVLAAFALIKAYKRGFFRRS